MPTDRHGGPGEDMVTVVGMQVVALVMDSLTAELTPGGSPVVAGGAADVAALFAVIVG